VYSRAGLSRTAALVVALALMALPTSAVARELGAAHMGRFVAETGAEQTRAGGIDLNHTSSNEILCSFELSGFVALAFYDSGACSNSSLQPVRSPADFERKPFEAAITGIRTTAQRDSATAKLTERIRKVE
jgi:hypothetical protein